MEATDKTDSAIKRLIGQEILRHRTAEREKDRLLAELVFELLIVEEAKIACKFPSNEIEKLRRQLDAAITARDKSPPSMQQYEAMKAELDHNLEILREAQAKAAKLLQAHLVRQSDHTHLLRNSKQSP